MAIQFTYQSWTTSRRAAGGAVESADVDRVSPMVACATAIMLPLADLAILGVTFTFLAPGRTLSWAWPFVAAVVALNAATGAYHTRITPSVVRDLRPLCAAVGLSLAAVFVARPHWVPPDTAVEIAALSVVLMLGARGLFYSRIRTLRTRGVVGDRTLIIGAGEIAQRLAGTFEAHPEYGLRPVGFVDRVDDDDLPLQLFGDTDLLRFILFEERIDRVVVAFGVTREADMVDAFRACQDAEVDIHVLPRFFELGVPVDGRDVDDVWGFPLVRLRRSPWRNTTWMAKRALDVVVSGLGLLLCLPLYGAVALSVKVSSSGPVHFRQKRVGRRGDMVEVIKFRTMHVHDGSDSEWTASRDRVTRVGRVMRSTGLDELPQLWNIFRGDMSLVGPRPERPYFVEQFRQDIPSYDARHRVPVGLTGLAQVHGLRGDTDIDERCRFDNRYIENWSLWRDIVILLRTVSAVVREARRSRAEATTASVTAASTLGEPVDTLVQASAAAKPPATSAPHVAEVVDLVASFDAGVVPARELTSREA